MNMPYLLVGWLKISHERSREPSVALYILLEDDNLDGITAKKEQEFNNAPRYIFREEQQKYSWSNLNNE